MSVELIIISVAVLSIFITTFAIIDYRNSEIQSAKQRLDSKDMADIVAWNINEAYISGFGARGFFYVSNTTDDDTSVNITIYPSKRFVKIEWNQRFYTAPLVTSRITGNISGNTSANMTLIAGRVNLTNVLGEIQIEQ